MPYATSNGIELFYTDTGGDLPVVIFSHGFLMDHEMFEPQIEALRHRYRCIAWDQRGHGQTATGTTAPFDLYDSADDCLAVLRHAGASRAVLAGMSQGGFLSLRCALRHPEAVRALILLDTQAGPENPANLPGYQAMMNEWAAHGLSPQTGETIAHIIIGAGWPGAAAWQAKWAKVQSGDLLPIFDALVGRDDIGDAIARIDVPALVVHGDADIAIAPALGEAMRLRLSRAEPLVAIPGAGHGANLTHPAPVNAAVLAFLDALPA